MAKSIRPTNQPKRERAGFITINRSILDSDIWKTTTPAQKTVMMTLMMMVYFAAADWKWKGESYRIQQGQIITSASKILKLCGPGISRQSVRSTIQKLKANQLITVESTSHGMLITIDNSPFWRIYDDNPTSQNDATQPARSENPTSTTNNNILKNKTIDKNIYKAVHLSFIKDERLIPSFSRFIEHLKENNHSTAEQTLIQKYKTLNKLSQSATEQIQIIEQAIEYGHKTFYPLKKISESKGKSSGSTKISNIGNFDQRRYEPEFLSKFEEDVSVLLKEGINHE